MRLLVLVLVLALSAAFVCASDESDASNVLVLTDENLEAEIAAHKPIFIEFYAPWCGHCKNLAPEWEKVATELVGQVTVAKIDASVHAQAAQEFGIQGFPTLKWIDSAADTDFQVTDYNGARDVASMVSWARRRLQPIPRLNTQELVDLATGVSDVWVLFNFDQHHESYETMRQYALSAESVTFISVFDEAANGIEPGQIFVGSNWISKQQYTGELSALPVWVNRNAYPLVQQVESNGALVFSRLFSSGLPFALVFLNEESQEENIAELNQIAEELRSVFLFAWLDTAQWADVLPRLGASGTYLPTAIAWDGSQAQQRPLVWDEDKTFTFLGLKHWAIDIANGVGTSWRQSQPIPTEQPGPVHQIVWKTWAQDVEESSVPVFVEFYSPGCGHCKALQPTWDDLAETFNTDKQVVIAKYDATANYAKDEWEIQGYPTLKLFKQGAQPVDYNGARDLESLIAFVEENI